MRLCTYSVDAGVSRLGVDCGAATLDLAVGSVGVLLARAEQAFRVTYRRQTHP